MTRRADAPDIIGTPDHGPLFAQREASPDVAHPAPRGRATVNGGSALALERIAPALTGLRGRVYGGIVAYGPVTRETLAATLGMKENTVNGRCAELVAAKLVRITGYDRETGRGKLEAVPTPTED